MIDRLVKAPTRVKGRSARLRPRRRMRRSTPICRISPRFFASDSLEEILAALEADDSDWAQTELGTLGPRARCRARSRLRLLAEGAKRASFADEMRAEYALAGRVVRTHDFREGVRALLIDKDNEPQWDPATPEEVTDEMLDVLFAPLPEAKPGRRSPEAQE